MRSTFRGLVVLAMSLATVAAPAADEPGIVELRVLSPRMAHAVVLAAVQECLGRGYQVSASLVDRNGNLSAFLRDPLSGPHTIKVSQQKAFTAATTQMPTAELASRPDLSFAPDMLLIVGGVPISFNGHFYGGVAVAGATPEVDAECAGKGIEAISDTMDFVE